MKSKLTFAALLSIASLATVGAADATGIVTASGVAYAVPFGAFISALVFMTFSLDYGRTYRPLPVAAPRTIMLPADEAFTAEELVSRRTAARRAKVARRRRRLAAV